MPEIPFEDLELTGKAADASISQSALEEALKMLFCAGIGGIVGVWVVICVELYCGDVLWGSWVEVSRLTALLRRHKLLHSC